MIEKENKKVASFNEIAIHANDITKISNIIYHSGPESYVYIQIKLIILTNIMIKSEQDNCNSVLIHSNQIKEINNTLYPYENETKINSKYIILFVFCIHM